MTKIPLKPKKYQNTLQNSKNDQNTLETQKITKIPLKSKNWPKYLQNPKNDQNTLKTWKLPKYPQNP